MKTAILMVMAFLAAGAAGCAWGRHPMVYDGAATEEAASEGGVSEEAPGEGVASEDAANEETASGDAEASPEEVPGETGDEVDEGEEEAVAETPPDKSVQVNPHQHPGEAPPYRQRPIGL